MDVEEWVNNVMCDGQFDYDNIATAAIKHFKNPMAGEIVSEYIDTQLEI